MKKILSILIFLAISQTSFASSLDYKGLKKLSKNNTFMDGEGKPFSDDKITNKKNTLLIIYNHGSGSVAKTDPCKADPKFGYIWEGAGVPAILQLHNKKINELEDDNGKSKWCVKYTLRLIKKYFSWQPDLSEWRTNWW